MNLLCALETVALLLAGGPDAKPGKDANVVANQTMFAQVLIFSFFFILFIVCSRSVWVERVHGIVYYDLVDINGMH